MPIEKITTFSRFAFSFSLVCLAAAIAYFSWSLINVSKNIAPILNQVDDSAVLIQDIIEQVDDVNQQIPDILERVDAINRQIPNILETVDKVNASIPLITEETAAIRNEVPAILEETAAIRGEIPAILDEVAEVRTLVPNVVEEVGLVRESIPPTLDRVDDLIENARRAGREVTEGATTGVFTGIIKMPFSLAKGIGNTIFPGMDVSEKDRKEVVKKIQQLANSGQPGDSVTWKGSKGAEGQIVLLRDTEHNGLSCRVLEVLPKEIGGGPITLCKTKNDEWKLAK